MIRENDSSKHVVKCFFIFLDELVIFELVQLSEYSDGAVRLASYSTNARDFLYPYPTLAPSYSAHDREVLMCRTVAFPVSFSFLYL